MYDSNYNNNFGKGKTMVTIKRSLVAGCAEGDEQAEHGGFLGQ